MVNPHTLWVTPRRGVKIGELGITLTQKPPVSYMDYINMHPLAFTIRLSGYLFYSFTFVWNRLIYFFPLVRARTPTLYSRVPRRSSMMTLWGVIVFDTELCAHADKRYQKGERNNWSINNNVEYRILHQENVLLFFLILSLFTKKYRAIALCNNVTPFLNCVLFKCSWKGFWLLYFNTCIMKLGFPFISSRRLSSKCTLVF